MPQVSRKIQLAADGEKLDTSCGLRSQSGQIMAQKRRKTTKFIQCFCFTPVSVLEETVGEHTRARSGIISLAEALFPLNSFCWPAGFIIVITYSTSFINQVFGFIKLFNNCWLHSVAPTVFLISFQQNFTTLILFCWVQNENEGWSGEWRIVLLAVYT